MRETSTRAEAREPGGGVDCAHDAASAVHAINTDDRIIPTRNEYRGVIALASEGRDGSRRSHCAAFHIKLRSCAKATAVIIDGIQNSSESRDACDGDETTAAR